MDGESIKTDAFTLTRIRVRLPVTWADLMFSEETGLVMIVSDYGNWSHWWPRKHIGSPTVAAFLGEVHRDSAGGKFLGGKGQVYSEEKTRDLIKEIIVDLRRTGSLSRVEAREEWTLLDVLEERGFSAWYFDTSLGDAGEFHSTELDHNFRMFWEQIWRPHIVPALRELAEKAA